MEAAVDAAEAWEACARARVQAAPMAGAVIRADANVASSAAPSRVAHTTPIVGAPAVAGAILWARGYGAVDASPAGLAHTPAGDAVDRQTVWRRVGCSALPAARAILWAVRRRRYRARGAAPPVGAYARAALHVAPPAPHAAAFERLGEDADGGASGPFTQRATPAVVTHARAPTSIARAVSRAIERASTLAAIGASPRALAHARAGAPVACAVAGAR